MPSPESRYLTDKRPEFMATLGLLPPYEWEDVKRAYRDKAKTAHPDHGGEISQFRKIQTAYEHALHYVEFSSNKREWIANRMDSYLARQTLELELQQLGADVTIAESESLKNSFGEFAELAATIDTIALLDSEHGPQLVELIVSAQSSLTGLRRLTLAGSHLNDPHALRLACLASLEALDLSRTQVTSGISRLVDEIPAMMELNLDKTRVGWLSRRRIANVLRKRSEKRTAAAALNPYEMYRQGKQFRG